MVQFNFQVAHFDFYSDELTLVVSSIQHNLVSLYVHDTTFPNYFKLLKIRQGVIGNYSKVKFSDENDNSLVGITDCNQAEIRHISLLNECASLNFTKLNQNLRRIQNFDISLNRAQDWSNIITTHEDSEKTCMWSSEDKKLIKPNLKPYDNQLQKEDNYLTYITSTTISKCGNFIIIGMDNGKAVKCSA